MSFAHTLILGLIAGGTIVLGLPVGRLTETRPFVRQFLSALAVGVLVFLVWDVLSHAWEPVDIAVSADTRNLGHAFGYGALMFAGLAVGLLSLVWFERRAVGESELDNKKLSMMIAIGIGLHNFGEGLAIGNSAASGAIGLATVLVVGFALHNATEGFGITAPLAGGDKPSWGYLGLLGLIGGGPTLIGTLVGYKVTSEPLGVVFLSLAAGSILYVVIQLIGVAARARRTDILASGLLLGLIAGFITDAIVTAGGA
ncbi:hypothetical protein Back2_26690 [Nocardioides baekrokdamisoli]|uniref:Zinc permease n=1 Tax=Nocardioides baekrokdamisoli TaxID=1804624 RepID=A0A3G9IJN9_9ACTN|nr:ZIP family metal transporter [Nocardioides baekrokdamisoli]BBH18382.1 hypothetical protein Back2_26690 [Nocardioides baekrokdamisoli]